jgi:aspartate kinase
LISYEEKAVEQPLISGIAYDKDEAKLSIRGIPDEPGIAHRVLGPVSDAHINVDVILQNVGEDGMANLTFTVHRNDYPLAKEILEKTAAEMGAQRVDGDENIAKISVVGVGMRSHAGVASRMFKSLSEEGINILMIATSEIKISVVVEDKYTELAVRALHRAFELDQPR